MYLTRFPINRARRGAHKLLGSPQAMHAAVLCSFPPQSPAPDGRVLWRVDRNGPGMVLYVLSPDRPDLTHLVEQAGWPVSDVEPWQTRSYEGLLDRLQNGQRWAFRLRANPVKAAKDIGKRVAHVTVAQQVQWLLDRTEVNGFAIPEGSTGTAVTVTERGVVSFARAGGQVTLATAQFDGALDITDVAAFRSALVNGLGRAKGYGCGLLTVVRPPT